MDEILFYDLNSYSLYNGFRTIPLKICAHGTPLWVQFTWKMKENIFAISVFTMDGLCIP